MARPDPSTPAKADEAVRVAHGWFEHNSGWAPPDDDTLAEWLADGACRCPDECGRWRAPCVQIRPSPPSSGPRSAR